jgi:hypothetical protein
LRIRLLLLSIVVAAVVAAPAAGSSTAVRFFITPGKNVNCELGLNRQGMHPGTYAWCLAYRGGSPYRTAVAVQMDASAKLKPCHGLKCIGNGPGQPTLKVGHSIDFGPFRCTALRKGVRCIVSKLGRGFRLSTRGLVRV